MSDKKRPIVQRTLATHLQENNPKCFFKLSNVLNRHFTKEDIQMAKKPIKRCQPCQSSEKCKLKPYEIQLCTK